jgi:hypothetical protein
LAYTKRHEKCVLFLEEGFGTTVNPLQLEQAGFEVRCFAKIFQKDGQKEENVKDPRIIDYCYTQKFVLVTMDKNIRFTHVEDIKRTDIAIIATESCDKYPPATWVAALILGKAKILSAVKRHPRPWFAHISTKGELRAIETITTEMITRRDRPMER